MYFILVLFVLYTHLTVLIYGKSVSISPRNFSLNNGALTTHLLNQTCPTPPQKLFEAPQNQFCRTESNITFLESARNSSESSNIIINSYQPWDSQPQCLNLTPEKALKYCIFTSSAFAHSRGISILTAPSIAASIASSIGFTTPPPPIYPSPTSPQLYFETELPGRGKGLIANHTFHKGELILSSTPVFIFNEETFEKLLPGERFVFQTKAVQKLPAAAKTLFYELAGHFGGDRVEDIVRTNAFGARFGEKGAEMMHGIVVPEAARLNHACRPNARFAFDPISLTHKIHATRTIQPGEELTISYIDEKQPFPARQSHIRNQWGFKCTCTHCTLPSAQIAASDTRLTLLTTLRKALLDFSQQGLKAGAATPEKSLQLIELYKEEQLHGAMAESYMLAAFRFCVWGNRERSREFAELAVGNWLVWEKGGGKGNLEVLRRMKDKPEECWCWGLRK